MPPDSAAQDGVGKLRDVRMGDQDVNPVRVVFLELMIACSYRVRVSHPLMQRLVPKCPTSVQCRTYAQHAPQRQPTRPQSFRYRGKSKGHGPDLPLIAISKTMANILAHNKDVPMRHGYMRVRDLVSRLPCAVRG